MELSFHGGSLSWRDIITHISFQVFCTECEWPPSSFNHPFSPSWWLLPSSQVMLNLNYTTITAAEEKKKKKKTVIRALSPFIFLSYMMNESLLFFWRHRLQLSKLSPKKEKSNQIQKCMIDSAYLPANGTKLFPVDSLIWPFHRGSNDVRVTCPSCVMR